MRAHDELISLASVGLSYAGPGGRPVFQRLNLCLPMDRRLAVLGPRKSGKTTLLQMIAGKLAPDSGQIRRPRAVSPVANSGALFHPNLSLYDNILFVARAYSLDGQTLAAAALAPMQRRIDLAAPLKTHDHITRRMLETATVAALPFACCLIDDLAQLPQDFAERLVATVERRGGGLIFSSVQGKAAARHADAVVVISQAGLYPFAVVEEGVAFLERHAR